MRGNGAGEKGVTQVIANGGSQQRPGAGPAQGAGPTSPDPRPEGIPPATGGTNGGSPAASQANGGQQAATGVSVGSVQVGDQSGQASAKASKNQGQAQTQGQNQNHGQTQEQGSSGDRSRVRRARLRTVRMDPWSVMKTAFLLSIAFGIVTVVAVGVIWQVLDTAGVYDSVNRTVGDVLNTGNAASGKEFDVMDYVGLQKVLGFATLIAVVDVVLITALATLGAFLYNLSASLLGGVELTLAEDE